MQRRGVLGWAGALARAGAGVTRRTRLGAPGGPAGTFGYRGTPTHAGGQVEQAGEVRQVQGRGLDLRRCQHGHRRFGGRGKFPGQGRAGQPFGVPLDEPWQAGHVVGLQILHDPGVVGGYVPVLAGRIGGQPVQRLRRVSTPKYRKYQTPTGTR